MQYSSPDTALCTSHFRLNKRVGSFESHCKLCRNIVATDPRTRRRPLSTELWYLHLERHTVTELLFLVLLVLQVLYALTVL